MAGRHLHIHPDDDHIQRNVPPGAYAPDEDAGYGMWVPPFPRSIFGLNTLVLGTVVVNTTAITASTRVFLTAQTLGTVTVPSALAVSARTPGVSFTILASSLTDTSTVGWVLFEP